MKALTLHEPWASLVAHGVKRTETRGAPPAGPMCRPGVRPLPGFAVEPGERIALAAAASKPYTGDPHGWIGPFCLGRWAEEVVHADPCDCELDDEELGTRCGRKSGARPALFRDEGAHGFSLATMLSSGAVVATAVVVTAVRTEEIAWTNAWSDWRMVTVMDDDDHETLILGNAQRPYGDYSPGRFVLPLDDVRALVTPVPVSGRQGVWDWPDGDHLDPAATVRPDKQGDPYG